MSVVKHLTLGTGWGGYTLSTELRPAEAKSGEDPACVVNDPVYQALLKRLKDESLRVSRNSLAQAQIEV
jgi:hypothetical protein